MSFRNAHMKARNHTGVPRGYNLNARWPLGRAVGSSSEPDSDDGVLHMLAVLVGVAGHSPWLIQAF